MVNEFRPYQARETIITVIDHQAKQKEEAQKNIEIALEKAKNTLSYCRDKLTQCVAIRHHYTTASHGVFPVTSQSADATTTMMDFSAERQLHDDMVTLSCELEGIIQQSGVI